MSDRSITAETIGSAARFDPQLRVPRRPRLRRGLVVSTEADQVVVTGPPKKQLFRGSSATDLLPALLALLDGERTHAGIAAELGRPEDVIFKALSLLWTCGVVEDGPPAEAEAALAQGIDGRLADFLSRVGSATEANACWEQAATRLRTARVEIFGAPALAALLRDELTGSIPVALGAGATPSERVTLVVWADAADTGSDGAGTGVSALAEHCWEKGIPLLRLRVRGRRAALGPLVDPRTTPCLDCLTAHDADDDARAGTETDGGREPHRASAEGDLALAVALFVRDLFAAVSRTTPTPLPMRWRLVNLETLSQRDTAAATRPGCPRCSVAEGPTAEHAAPATRFEASVAMPPKEFADLKAHQMHYKPSNLALQRLSRTWPVAGAVELLPPEHTRLGRRWPAAQPGPDTLALLLSVTAGIKADAPDKVARWTASGGNIGSVTAYAVVRDVPGLASGIYGYVAAEHRLALLSSRTDAVTGDRPLTLVLTGDFPKVARKYSAFALRIVLLDSGCAQATAREAAQTLGIRFALRPRWDDDAIAAGLGINPDMEPVTAVIDLGEAT
ncbi:TOMM precursor leader peptide-binding protein [Streptomyces sp. NPDC056835]|uniref:TOMM precursor leader peptide-binding protein n=1 Tax=Streptomyces sp. NPDC056835 TaxID=3345956 RepID=UPI003684C6B0